MKPVALVVFLENVGHIQGVSLPGWAMAAVDWVTEEYAKVLLHLYGAYRCYDRVILLEDADATGPMLAETLLSASRAYTVDLLLLVHGENGVLVGYRGKEFVGAETFSVLHASYCDDPASLDLRAVYGLNCYGLSLAWNWIALGAKVANGAAGVNWFPEPSLSVFLRNWLRGELYSKAVQSSNESATRWWRRVLPRRAAADHPWIVSSRQVVVGQHDVTIHS